MQRWHAQRARAQPAHRHIPARLPKPATQVPQLFCRLTESQNVTNLARKDGKIPTVQCAARFLTRRANRWNGDYKSDAPTRAPADITYLALSHYHGDHVANANAFAGSTWIVQQGDRDAIFAARRSSDTRRNWEPSHSAYFTDLVKSKTLLLKGEDHDVFGDGTVVIKFTPGHTPGHQSLFLKLAKTGPVLLSGDLYHYPEEMTYKRIPSFDFDKEQTAKSRAMIEEFVKKNNAQLWIQHDYTAGIKRKIAPEFYE